MSVDHEFWHARWRDGTTAWHRERPHRALVRHLDVLGLPEQAQVLVPLCGKSVDMRWLIERRMQVLGVELSPIAARDFFDEYGLRFDERREGAFTVFAGGGVCILCGDVFDLQAHHLERVAAVYDRAALVALDAPTRERYVQHLGRCLPAGASQLLVAMDYDRAQMDGPPFAVPPEEVRRLFARRYAVRLMESAEILHEEPALRGRGLTALAEHVFVLLDNGP